MIKILIAEDEQEKKRVLVEAALEVEGVTIENITFASNVHEAKLALKKTKFDLLILDINMPKQADKHTEIGSGLEVLHFIENNFQAIPPSYILGMSAYDEGMKAAEVDFSFPLWKLVRFDYTDDAWREPLKKALGYLGAKKTPPYFNDGRTYHVDVGIVVALEEELNAVLALNCDWKRITIPHDSNTYFGGKISLERQVDIVLVCSPRMGMPSAAVTASQLINSFRPRYLLSAGICAGVRKKTNVGDILIADPCFDWSSGKWIREKGKHLKFHPAAYQWRADRQLIAIAKELSSASNVLDEIYSSYKMNKPALPPKLLIDAMASGGSVLQAEELMHDVQEQHKNLIGVEMETYAIFNAAENAPEPRPKYIAFKSVCDFGDESKVDDAHHYGCFTSAQFIYNFILKLDYE